jgi:hypothetical protein
MAKPNITDLHTRVQALGFELVTNAEGAQFVLDGTQVVFARRYDGDHSLIDWLVERETERKDELTVIDTGLPPDAIADDFRQPNVAELYERFLGLLINAAAKDRFKAMDVREKKGVEAAIQYLLGSSVTEENKP